VDHRHYLGRRWRGGHGLNGAQHLLVAKTETCGGSDNTLHRPPQSGRVCANTKYSLSAVQTWRILMPKYLGALTIVLLLGMVLIRISVLRRQGIKAMKFGNIDKTDFLIPLFALFYFYVLFAAAFHWPTMTTNQFFHSEIISWTGVLFCLAGLSLFVWSLISFRQSFRVGIDADHPDKLITDGIFAFSRNPIYVAFAIILFGVKRTRFTRPEFFPNPTYVRTRRDRNLAKQQALYLLRQV
jgi:protein-S-isoprenylcysteine O-methyltransferase Ste14